MTLEYFNNFLDYLRWQNEKRTSNFSCGARDQCSEQSTDNSDTETAQTDCKKGDEAKYVLLSTDMAFHSGEGDHHRIENDGYGICNKPIKNIYSSAAFPYFTLAIQIWVGTYRWEGTLQTRENKGPCLFQSLEILPERPRDRRPKWVPKRPNSL